ncbi:MAG: hypothetical protein DI549_20515 [Ancylobacter novellus]|uniref:Uncharacterized protein n=1 Tax=Ancylobacter novellus TaxID=921 RepID=A0A2W5QKW4_ANCNO|nr:MAG: hypothetical protein DI549_20515 [Ancylobacter novellus]
MPVIVIVPPQPILDVQSLRRLTPGLDALDDDHLAMLIGVVQSTIEPDLGWPGRSFGRQTLELLEEMFPADYLPLPYPPVTSVVSVRYLDRDGSEQEIPAERYRAELSDKICGVRPAAGCEWPRSSWGFGAVRIRFVAGFTPEDPKLLPAKQAVSLGVQALRAVNREDLFLRRERVEGVAEKEWAVNPQAERLVREAADRLLQPYRVYV